MLNRINHLVAPTPTVKNDPQPKAEAEQLQIEAEIARVVAEYRKFGGFADLGEAVPPNRHQRRRYRARGRHYNDKGVRRAVIRALTGARRYLSGSAPSLAAAAESVGSGVNYIRMAIVLLQAEDSELVNAVLHGDITLFAAAMQAEAMAALVVAARAAGPAGVATLLHDKMTKAEQVQTGDCLGVDWTWDSLIMPLVGPRSEAGQPRPQV